MVLNRAGPKLRAGFTETPVICIPIICIMTRVRPITSPANYVFEFLCVAPRITKTKINVAMNSKTAAEYTLYSPP